VGRDFVVVEILLLIVLQLLVLTELLVIILDGVTIQVFSTVGLLSFKRASGIFICFQLDNLGGDMGGESSIVFEEEE
jgi:hypothetical protein